MSKQFVKVPIRLMRTDSREEGEAFDQWEFMAVIGIQLAYRPFYGCYGTSLREILHFFGYTSDNPRQQASIKKAIDKLISLGEVERMDDFPIRYSSLGTYRINIEEDYTKIYLNEINDIFLIGESRANILSALKVFCNLISRTNGTKPANPSIATISADLNMSNTTTADAIKLLKEHKLLLIGSATIVRESGLRRSNNFYCRNNPLALQGLQKAIEDRERQAYGFRKSSE